MLLDDQLGKTCPQGSVFVHGGRDRGRTDGSVLHGHVHLAERAAAVAQQYARAGVGAQPRDVAGLLGKIHLQHARRHRAATFASTRHVIGGAIIPAPAAVPTTVNGYAPKW